MLRIEWKGRKRRLSRREDIRIVYHYSLATSIPPAKGEKRKSLVLTIRVIVLWESKIRTRETEILLFSLLPPTSLPCKLNAMSEEKLSISCRQKDERQKRAARNGLRRGRLSWWDGKEERDENERERKTPANLMMKRETKERHPLEIQLAHH